LKLNTRRDGATKDGGEWESVVKKTDLTHSQLFKESERRRGCVKRFWGGQFWRKKGEGRERERGEKGRESENNAELAKGDIGTELDVYI